MVQQDNPGHHAPLCPITLIMTDIRKDIGTYIRDVIIPEYAHFDSAHREDHAMTVIDQAMNLLDTRQIWIDNQDQHLTTEWAEHIDREVLIMAAACHDLGLAYGREMHHIHSGQIIRADKTLRKWFTESQIETIAQAAEDHRASGKSSPRSIYGKIVAEADRVIDSETIIRRTVQFGLKNYPELDREGHILRAISHLHEKYGRGGYLKLWIPWSDNSIRLQALQDIIEDSDEIYRTVGEIYDSLTSI